MRLPTRVVKVGGSLLRPQPEAPRHQPEAPRHQPDAPRHQPDAQAKETALFSLVLTQWLAQQSPAVNLLIAGGGELADLIRRADAAQGLGEEAAHWLCVDALSITARLLAATMKVSVVTEKWELPFAGPSVCVFDPAPFLRTSESRLFATPLPHSWAVTSDSIAARVAEFLAASELVLLKSCLPAAAPTAGYVDDYFPAAVSRLPRVRCVNLRSPGFEEIIWEGRHREP